MSRLRRLLRRIDVALACAVGAAAALLSGLVLFAIAGFAVVESLEERAAELARRTKDVAELVEAPDPPPALLAEFPFRVRGPGGEVVESGGAWDSIRNGRAVDATWRSALLASPRDYLLHGGRLDGGRVLEVALPLRHFARERGELLRATGWILAASLVATLALGVIAARRALAPLRNATRAVREVDARRLAARVPVRGVGDDVDALAEAINEVLARLETAFVRMDAFGGEVAHELRTPLNRIVNRAEVALLESSTPGADAKALAAIRATAEEMRRVLESLLLLARGEEGRLVLRRERVDLGARIAQLVELYAPAAEEGGRSIACRAPTAPAPVDAPLLERAVGNLLDNALRHTPPGGRIEVSVDAAGRDVRVRVEDSGPGIRPAERAHVFERFVQLDPVRPVGAAGLGLPIARMIARLHGGDLTVADSALGGAAFELEIPAAVRPAADYDAAWPLWSRTSSR